MQHPRKLGVEHIENYLTHLAVNRNVSASTQNLAFSTLLFLYKQVLEIELPKLDGVTHAKQSTRVPVVFTADEASHVIQILQCLHAGQCGFFPLNLKMLKEKVFMRFGFLELMRR